MGEDKQSRGGWSNTSWENRLNQSGLGGLVHSILDAMRPAAPIAASLLWIAQPAFAMFGRAEEIESLANRLNDPLEDVDQDRPPSGSE
jgi:hypothetical protein